MLKRILIIEDNAEHLEVLNEALSYFNFLIKAIPDGTELINITEDFKPDLFLLDYILPGESGVDLCNKLKGNLKTKAIPVIIMSGYQGVLEQFDCCDAFLYKPLDLNLLLEKIDDLLYLKLPVA
ncbi:response regulator [Pelobium sp.]|nr:response regulator [Pelobium sp.]MDA9555541.1 response regulator [Pelobium sp.]